MVPFVLRSDSPAATRGIGRRLGRYLRPGDVVLLQGELGAGKTCLAQGIGEGLGAGQRVKSSAFVLVNEYEGRLKMHLADLYRLSEASEVTDRAWEEMPSERLLIRLEWVGERSRELSLEPEGARARELAEKLASGAGSRGRRR
jgi:tRNA threonylcarbamoyladenosine biosynthesis protein TsaE